MLSGASRIGIKRALIGILVMGFIGVGMLPEAAAKPRRNDSSSVIEDVIPPDQLRPGQPTPHHLLAAMAARAASMNQLPNTSHESITLPVQEVDRSHPFFPKDHNTLPFGSETIQEIARAIGVDVDQIEGIAAFGTDFVTTASIPPHERIIYLVSVVLKGNGGHYLGRVIWDNRNNQSTGYSVGRFLISGAYDLVNGSHPGLSGIERIASRVGVNLDQVKTIQLVVDQTYRGSPGRPTHRLLTLVTLQDGRQFLGDLYGEVRQESFGPMLPAFREVIVFTDVSRIQQVTHQPIPIPPAGWEPTIEQAIAKAFSREMSIDSDLSVVEIPESTSRDGIRIT